MAKVKFIHKRGVYNPDIDYGYTNNITYENQHGCGIVYVVEFIDTDMSTASTKVGCTNCPHKRIYDLSKIAESHGRYIKRVATSDPCLNYTRLENTIHKTLKGSGIDYVKGTEYYNTDYNTIIHMINRMKLIPEPPSFVITTDMEVLDLLTSSILEEYNVSNIKPFIDYVHDHEIELGYRDEDGYIRLFRK